MKKAATKLAPPAPAPARPRRKVQEGTELPSPLRLLPDVGEDITETDIAIDNALGEVVESAMFSSLLWASLKR